MDGSESLDCANGSFDFVSIPNRFGPTDLGALELTSLDRIFASGIGDAMPPIGCND